MRISDWSSDVCSSDLKAKALRVLRTRLYEAERERLHAERSGTRRAMVGSGDRSERIRTYNFPQGRVTDHRINLTLHRLPEILEGEMDEIGRASWRGRECQYVWISVVAVPLKKKRRTTFKTSELSKKKKK